MTAVIIDPHYIPAFDIEDVLLDKDTGAPLSGGLVYFWQDDQRLTPKNVWQITGTSPNYTFTQLPNPMVLSSIGTFEDSLANPVIPYFYPYDAAGNPQYYYIEVFSSGMVPQFVRQAVPYVADTGSTVLDSAFVNELSNPQFAAVLFDTTQPSCTFNFSAASNQVVSIAPGWDIVVTCSGAGTVTLEQFCPAGSLNEITNPGSILNIQSSGLTTLLLRQRLYGSPNLWGDGYLSGTFVAKNYTGTNATLNLYYSQSVGLTNVLLESATLVSGAGYAAFPFSVLIPASTNSQTFPGAYIDIAFSVPVNIEIDITSVMLASTGLIDVPAITYDQTSLDRQEDQLFHYYGPQLSYKPIPSWLVGWDFPLNPCQELGPTSTAPVSTGANGSYYIADQTILFQTVDSSFSLTQNQNGFNFTAANTTPFALIQYFPLNTSLDMINSRLSIAVNTFTNQASLNGSVNLFYTTNAAVPVLPLSLIVNIGSSNSFPIIAPANLTAGWTAIPRALGPAIFTSTNAFSQRYFNGWDPTGISVSTVKAVAIVIAFNPITAGNISAIRWASLCSGDIATQPAPQTLDEVLRECQFFYQKSFLPATPPAQNAGTNTGETYFIQGTAATNLSFIPVRFSTPMRVTPVNPPVFYNPTATNAYIHDFSVPNDYSDTGLVANTLSANGFVIQGHSVAGSAVGNLIGVHWTANARLGII